MSTYRVSKTVYSGKRNIPYPYVAEISIGSETVSVKEIECANNVPPQLMDWILLFAKLIQHDNYSPKGLCRLMINDHEPHHPQSLILGDFYDGCYQYSPINGIGLWCKQSAANIDGRSISQILEEIYVIENYHSIPKEDLWIDRKKLKESGSFRDAIYSYLKEHNPDCKYRYYEETMDSFIANRRDWEITQLSD